MANFLKLFRISSISLKKSRWSSSTFKITAVVGKKERKLFVYSQLSLTKFSECPMRRFPPIEGIIPPTRMVGSQFPSIKIWETIEGEVVFP